MATAAVRRAVPDGELGMYFDALRPLRKLYGSLPASEFGPLALAALQEHMITLDWCRTFINAQICPCAAVCLNGPSPASSSTPRTTW